MIRIVAALIAFVSVSAQAGSPQAASALLAAHPFSMSSDPARTVAVQSAWVAHTTGPKPAGWTEAVKAIVATSDPLKKIALADGFVDGHLHYSDRGGFPWTFTPTQAFTQGAALCRDYAVAKIFLLLDAGFPAGDLRIVTLAPDSVHKNYHVVTLARVHSRVFVLDMLRTDTPRGGYAIPADQADVTGSTGRTPVAAVSPAGWTIPIQEAALPETP